MEILETEMRNKQRTMLVGPPGIGKTAIIHSVAKKQGFKTSIDTAEGEMSTVIRASLMERVDLTGCMVPDTKKNVTRQLPFVLIKALQETKDPTLFFVDDMGQAPTDTQASLMRLFDNNFFPENVVVWAATNRPGDKAGVNSLCEPLRSRFDSVYTIPTPGGVEGEKKDDASSESLCSWKDYLLNWVYWAGDEANAPAEIIAWHRMSDGTSLYTWKPHADPAVRMADFRSWGSLIKRWNAGMRSLKQVSAVIGKAAATEFLAFAHLADSLPSPDQVWMDPKGAKLPPKNNVSAQWLISTVLAQAVQPGTAEAFVTYIARLDQVLTAYAAREAYRRLQQKLSGSKAWVRWFNENQELFNTR